MSKRNSNCGVNIIISYRWNNQSGDTDPLKHMHSWDIFTKGNILVTSGGSKYWHYRMEIFFEKSKDGYAFVNILENSAAFIKADGSSVIWKK